MIDRFAESYVAGETPVPCVDCNMAIKFKDLLGTARELGAKVLATGHYVASRALPDGGRALYRAKEEERDQSYFLFGTTHEQLDLLRFPLGDMTKARDARACAPLRPRGRRQARQPGHLLRADRPLHRHHRAAEARRCCGRRRGRSRRQGAGPPRRHHPFHRRPAARPEDRGRRAALRGGARRRGAARRGRPARGADRCGASRCATSTGSARARSTALLDGGRARGVRQGALDARAARGVPDAPPPAATRSNSSTAKTACRPARPACSTTAREGQARVLGGGFIRAAAATARAA